VEAVKTVTRMKKRRVITASIDVSREVPAGSIGMWDLPEARVRGRRIHARTCDDITGAAGALCCIDRLVRRGLSCDAYFLFTRAEEVGFMGAIAAARLKTIPRKCVVVVIENSSELIHAKMGDGPILRVGDRASVFTPGATAHCDAVARDLAKGDRRFKYQRKLMDGGMCESTAYCQFGYDATGICFALGNYHNVDRKRKRIAHEYIDLSDFANAVKWFVELARASRPYTSLDKTVQTQLAGVERTYGTLLRASRR
jgi:endoglucanase